VVQAGQTVRVRVVEIDRERGRVGLSMREPNAPRAPRPPAANRPTGGSAPPQPFEPAVSSVEGGAARGGGARRPDRGNRGREQARSEGRPRRRRRSEEEGEGWRTARGCAARDYYATLHDGEVEYESA